MKEPASDGWIFKLWVRLALFVVTLAATIGVVVVVWRSTQSLRAWETCAGIGSVVAWRILLNSPRRSQLLLAFLSLVLGVGFAACAIAVFALLAFASSSYR